MSDSISFNLLPQRIKTITQQLNDLAQTAQILNYLSPRAKNSSESATSDLILQLNGSLQREVTFLISDSKQFLCLKSPQRTVDLSKRSKYSREKEEILNYLPNLSS